MDIRQNINFMLIPYRNSKKNWNKANATWTEATKSYYMATTPSKYYLHFPRTGCANDNANNGSPERLFKHSGMWRQLNGQWMKESNVSSRVKDYMCIYMLLLTMVYIFTWKCLYYYSGEVTPPMWYVPIRLWCSHLSQSLAFILAWRKPL